MKRRKAGRWTALCLLAAVLAAVPAGKASGEESLPENAPEQAAVEETLPEAAGELTAVDEAMLENLLGQAAAGDEVSLEALLEQASVLIQDLDVEEVKAYYSRIESFVQSEEFQSLIQYEEVRDLITELVGRCVDVGMTDPEFTQKVLLAAGMDEKMVSLLLLLLDEGSRAGETVEAFKNSEEGKALLESLGLTLDRDLLTKALLELLLQDRTNVNGMEIAVSSPEEEGLTVQAGENATEQDLAEPATEKSLITEQTEESN